MSASTPAGAPAAPPGQPSLGADARLAPPLPAPPPDLRLLAGALLLLAVALSLVCLAAARLRRRPRPRDDRCQAVMLELDRVRNQATCPCGSQGLAISCPTAAQPPCADRVHGLLAEFAAATTGLPCSHLTTQELRDCERHVPVALREAFTRLVDTMAAADLNRFSARPAPVAAGCLVDAAMAALRDWPPDPATPPTPDGSRKLS